MANANHKGNGSQEDEQMLDPEADITKFPILEEESIEETQPEPIKKNVSIPETEFQALKKEGADYKDKYLRLLADNENTRKRMQKDKQELVQYAVQNVISDFLNPIDHMENALNFTQQMSEEVKHWAFGFQMILNQFKDILANNGVVPFVSLGTPFDPHMHEAIEMVETNDYPADTVAEESLKGYKIADRVIRPARVKVAKAPSKPQQTNNEEEQN